MKKHIIEITIGERMPRKFKKGFKKFILKERVNFYTNPKKSLVLKISVCKFIKTPMRKIKNENCVLVFNSCKSNLLNDKCILCRYPIYYCRCKGMGLIEKINKASPIVFHRELTIEEIKAAFGQ